MRRSIALSLMLLFGLMPMAPLLSPDADANLPACCRRNGRHHCSMRGMGQGGEGQKGFASLTEKCPCQPPATAAVHGPSYGPGGASCFFAGDGCPPAGTAQTRALARISFLCWHLRRGPPALLA